MHLRSQFVGDSITFIPVQNKYSSIIIIISLPKYTKTVEILVITKKNYPKKTFKKVTQVMLIFQTLIRPDSIWPEQILDLFLENRLYKWKDIQITRVAPNHPLN